MPRCLGLAWRRVRGPEQALVQQALGHAPLGHDEVLLTRERHRQSLAIALRNVQAAEQGLRQGVPLEFVAFDVTEALQQIAEVLGELYGRGPGPYL